MMQGCWYDWDRYSNVPWAHQWASHIMMQSCWHDWDRVRNSNVPWSHHWGKFTTQVFGTSLMWWYKVAPYLSFWVLGFVDLPLVASLFIPFHKNHCFCKQSSIKSHVSEVTWLAHMIASMSALLSIYLILAATILLACGTKYCWPVVQTSALMSEQSPFVYWRILTLGSSQKDGKWLSSLLKELMQAKVFSALLSPHLARPARTTQNIPE